MAHKNHIYNIDAIKHLAKKQIIIDLVFCGADKETWRQFWRTQKNNMEKQVKYLGYIDKRDNSTIQGINCSFHAYLFWSNKYTSA